MPLQRPLDHSIHPQFLQRRLVTHPATLLLVLICAQNYRAASYHTEATLKLRMRLLFPRTLHMPGPSPPMTLSPGDPLPSLH